MNSVLLINQIFLFLNVAVGCLLAFWVFSANRQEKVNRIFFIVTILMVLWTIFAFLGFSTKEPQKALIWYRLNYGVVALFFIVSYFFSIYFPKKIAENRFLTKFVVVLCFLLFLISVFSNLIISGVKEKEWGTEIIFGEGKLFYYIPIIILTLLIIYNLFKNYFVLPKQERLKIQYVLMGIFVFALANFIFNVGFTFLIGSVQFQHFGDYSVIFFLGFTAYAIVKRELFGIKVVLTALLVGLIAILLLLDIFVFTSQGWLQGLKGVIFVIFLYFGYLLIKSVLLEIQRRQEIEKIDKAKSEFISIASHQLRTPLTAVKGYISMILEGTYGQLAEKQVRPLENVYQSNERLIKLVNDLLNLSRLDAGKIEFSPELISLEEMVSDLIEELRINAEKKGLYMKMVKSLKPLPKIMVDQDKLRQVILNIIDNAIKYTNKGGITIELKKIDGEEEIKVSDTGEGMTKKEIESLFQMFSRATAGTQLHTEGAGLGLYVARQFIEMHGGKIWVESPGKSKGSTFYIQLPIHLDPKLLKTKTKTITKTANDIF